MNKYFDDELGIKVLQQRSICLDILCGLTPLSERKTPQAVRFAIAVQGLYNLAEKQLAAIDSNLSRIIAKLAFGKSIDSDYPSVIQLEAAFELIERQLFKTGLTDLSGCVQ